MTEYFKECSQCKNNYDVTLLHVQNFDGKDLLFCQDCLDEILFGERTIIV